MITGHDAYNYIPQPEERDTYCAFCGEEITPDEYYCSKACAKADEQD